MEWLMSKEPNLPTKGKEISIKYLRRRRGCSWACMTPDNPIVASTKRRGSYSRVTLAFRRRSRCMSRWRWRRWRSWGWIGWLIPCASTIDSHRLTIGTCQYKRAKKWGALLSVTDAIFEDTFIVVGRDVLENNLSITYTKWNVGRKGIPSSNPEGHRCGYTTVWPLVRHKHECRIHRRRWSLSNHGIEDLGQTNFRIQVLQLKIKVKLQFAKPNWMYLLGLPFPICTKWRVSRDVH